MMRTIDLHQAAASRRPHITPRLALHARYPVLLVTSHGDVRACNRLACWLCNRRSPRTLLGGNVFQEITRAINEGRILVQINSHLIRIKTKSLNRLDPDGVWGVHRDFERAVREAKARPGDWDTTASSDEAEERLGRHSLLRIRGPRGRSGVKPLEFAVIESLVQPGGEILIEFKPAEGRTEYAVAKANARLARRSEEGGYVFAMTDIDLELGSLNKDDAAMTSEQLIRSATASSVRVGRGEGQRIASTPEGVLSDTRPSSSSPASAFPVWTPGSGCESLLATIREALGKPTASITSHALYGPGWAWELGSAVRIEVYPGRAFALIHANDDRGERQIWGYLLRCVGVQRSGLSNHLYFVSQSTEGTRLTSTSLSPTGEWEHRLYSDEDVPIDCAAMAVLRDEGALASPSGQGVISVAEAARLMGVSRSYVHRLVRAKRLPALKIGTVFVVRERDARTFTRSRQRRRQ